MRIEGFDPLHEFEHLVLERTLSTLQRFEIGLQRLCLLRRGHRSVVQLLLDVRSLSFHRGDLVLESLLFSSETIALGLRHGRISTTSCGDAIQFDQLGTCWKCPVSMPKLVSGGVVGLKFEKPLEIGHGHSLAGSGPICRIGQPGPGAAMVEEVVDDLGLVVVVVDEVVERGWVVVVVAGFFVVVVVSTTVVSAAFRSP